MTKGEEVKEVNEDKISVLGAFDRRWVVYGAVGVGLGVIGKYAIIDNGIWEGVSWTILTFFLLYTFTLFLLFSHLTNNSNGYSGRSLRPNGLTRLRSYLTFLPITQIIQHGDGKEPLRANETLKIQSEKLNENELSIRISIQKELVIEAILDEYIAPWYTKISNNKIFLKQSKGILHSVFQQFGEKIRQVDRTELTKEAIQTVHLHWKEYCDAAEKSASTSGSILKCFKFVHPYLQDTAEVSNRYEHMICQLLENLVIPDLQSTLLCQFLSGILVKSFFLYYADFICQPPWINSNLITLLSSSSALAELAGSSSQNSSAPATPLPDSSETGPKTLPSEISSALQTPNYSESSTSGITPPTQILSSDKILENDSDNQYFFGRDTQEDLINGEKCQENLFDAHAFEKEKVGERSSPKFGIGSGPSSSVSVALSGILPTTALPLLPAGSSFYRLDHGPTFGFSKPSSESDNSSDNFKISSESISPPLKPLTSADVTIEPQKLSTVNINYSFSQSIEMNEFSSEERSQGTSFLSGHDREFNNSSRSSTPTHYYSFDEASKRKPSQLVDSGTLSVDGAVDSQRGDKSCNHELKIVNSDLEFKSNRSPVYEEPEDFATSIAKLRALLEQRDSKKNLNYLGTDDASLSDISSCASPDPNEACHEAMIDVHFKALEDIHMPDFPYNQIPEGINVNSSNQKQIITNQTDRPVHELKCYFFNIAIPKVESCNDSGGQYDFYCIQYEGVYFDEKFDDQLPKVILRTTTVKRRFKEFLLLQSKLEEHTIWKPHLKGVKAPNRWLNLSFSKADAAATRKAMLERYLQQVCYHPVLGTSREVLQFMAYGDDGFSLGPLDVHDPKHLLSDRLDKLARKFTGVMNSLRDVLPSFESTPPSPHSEVGSPLDNKPEYSIPSFQFHEKLSPEEMIANSAPDPKWIESLAPKFTKRHNSGEAQNPEDSDENFPSANDELNNSDIVSEDPVEEETVNSSYPLAAALTQLLCDVLWLPNCRPHNASVSTFMSISGKSLENYVHETIDVFLSEEAVLGYLEWLGKSLKVDADCCDELLCESVTEADLKNCLRRRIPAWVRWMWGRNRLDLTIERITGFFQNSTVNHDLVLSLGELLFSKIVKCEQNISTE